MPHVRVLKTKRSDAGQAAPRPRKKPVQSCAQVTLGALQEAFVRVLIERGFEKMTIREVVSVAGVGVGTFYDYVPNLRALVLRPTLTLHAGKPVDKMVAALLQALVQSGLSRPKEWTALLLLERQLS